ncbi:unnamed protein product [Ixodes pacificus]
MTARTSTNYRVQLGGVILLYTARIAGAKSCKIDQIHQKRTSIGPKKNY